MSHWSDIETALVAEHVVLLPTETVYGLAARTDKPKAISKIYAMKGRDFNKPLAVCVRDIDQAKTLAIFDEKSEALAVAHWPGSLTLVLNLLSDCDIDERATDNVMGARTIALRCPDVFWRKSIETPLALTSANRSGEADCVDYDEAISEFSDELSAGLAADAKLTGKPSTIIRVSSDTLKVLRQGELEVQL